MVKEEKLPEATPTNAEVNLRSKHLYKLFLFSLKIIPPVLAALYLGNTVLSYFGIDYSIISYVAGIGIIPWLFLMLASYVLRFCEYHRMFLWYIAANNTICWVDDVYGLPISDRGYLALHIIIAGIFLFVILYLHQKCRRKA